MKRFIKKIAPKFLLSWYHLIIAILAKLFYCNPSSKMIIIGVTGTSGKSSTCYFTAQILEQAGFKIGMTTTTLFKIANKEWLNDKKMTMLGRFQTQKLLKKMLKEKCEIAIIETSSQGIEQFRHIGINYDILIFTNLYPEHIEAHGGFENYKQAKGKLFTHLVNSHRKNIRILNIKKFGNSKIKKFSKIIPKISIINIDDKYAEYFLNFKTDKKIGFTTKNQELKIKNYNNDLEIITAKNLKREGNKLKTIINNLPASQPVSFESRSEPIGHAGDASPVSELAGGLFIIPLLGDYNIYNILAAVSVAKILGIKNEKIKQAVEKIKPLPGRLEFIKNNLGIKILIDYAFEPKAIQKLYKTIKTINHNKLIHILGSAGGTAEKEMQRDKSRRPVLGKLAGENADIIIITNEDPYDEDPMAIINEVSAGAQKVINQKYFTTNHLYQQKIGNSKLENKLYKILNRREAIRKALSLAKKDDLILLTGKGAEQAICIANGKKIKWDDREVVREELKKIIK